MHQLQTFFFFYQKNTMICGIDSYHDKGGGNSVGAFVASVDQMFTVWYSRACIQSARQELVDGIVQCFIGAIRKFLSVSYFQELRVI